MVSLNLLKRRSQSELVLTLSTSDVDDLRNRFPSSESNFSNTLLFDVEGIVSPYVHIILRPSSNGNPLLRNNANGFQIEVPKVDCDSYENVSKNLVLTVENDRVVVSESDEDAVDKRTIDVSEDDVIKAFRDAGIDGLTFNELLEKFPNAKREWIVRRLYEATNRPFGGVVASTLRRASTERNYAGTKIYFYSAFTKIEEEPVVNERNSDLRAKLNRAIFEAGENGITSFQLRMMFPDAKRYSLYPSLTRLSKKGLIGKNDDGSYRWLGEPPVENDKTKVEKKGRACDSIYAYLEDFPNGIDGWTVAENVKGFNVVQVYTSLSSLNNVIYDGGLYFLKTYHPSYVASLNRRTSGVPVKQFLVDLFASSENGVTSPELIVAAKQLNFVSVMVTLRAMMAHKEASFDGEAFHRVI